jgi:hypothetical protein
MSASRAGALERVRWEMGLQVGSTGGGSASQRHHNGVIHCNAVAFALGFEGLLENEVAVGMEGNDYVLVAGACSDRKAAIVIGEELAEWLCDNKHLVGRHFNSKR